MAVYKMKPGPVGKKVVDAYKGIEQKFTAAFLEKDETRPSGYTLKTGDTAEKVTAAYKTIENTVVGGYKKIENAFVDTFLEKAEEKKDEEN